MNVPDLPSDDEIRARLQRAANRAHAKLEDPQQDRLLQAEDELLKIDEPARPHDQSLDDPHFNTRLAQLEERTAAFRAEKEAAQRNVAATRRVSHEDTRHLAVGLAITYTFIGMPLCGLGIGALVGHFTGSSVACWFGGFLGLVAGCVASLVLLRNSNPSGH